MSSDKIAIRVNNLSKCYRIYDQPQDRLKQYIIPRMKRLIGRQPNNYFREFWALRDVPFEVKSGETIGIIGRNGSGKSTLLQIICGTLTPTYGTVETNGRIAALLELGSGFNPEFTGRENVYMNGAVLGLSKAEIDLRFDDIVKFADIGDFIDQQVKIYSSGMVVRLAFAVAINVDAQVLVVDEALAVGDAAFQRKCIRKIEELTADGMTLLFVSHDTETVKKICSKAIYLKNGVMSVFGIAKDVCIEYERDLFGASRHNNTQATSKNTEQVLPAYIDSDLLSSDEKTYGDGRATINKITITDPNNQIINAIPSGENFTISYNVEFNSTVIKPIFGIMITTREGICVFGTNTTNNPISLRDYLDDDEVLISFTLTNNLGPGIYYLTCGIHAFDHTDGLIYLQRRMDNNIFKSFDPFNKNISGLSHLFPIIKTKYLK